jgi:Integrase core domain/Transposase
MAETRRKFDHDFWEGAVRLVRETAKPIAQVARDLGIDEGTLGNWVNADKCAAGMGPGRWMRMSGRSWPGCAARDAELAMDGTQIATGEGRLHLVSVLDVAFRRVLGFALGERHDAQLAYGALAMAITVRGGQVPGVVFHTDQGSEGGFKRPSQHLVDGGVARDDARAAAAGSVVSGADPFPGAADGGVAAGPGGLLGGDRARCQLRGRGAGDRCVAGGWEPLVPERWRRGTKPSTSRVGAATCLMRSGRTSLSGTPRRPVSARSPAGWAGRLRPELAHDFGFWTGSKL